MYKLEKMSSLSLNEMLNERAEELFPMVKTLKKYESLLPETTATFEQLHAEMLHIKDRLDAWTAFIVNFPRDAIEYENGWFVKTVKTPSIPIAGESKTLVDMLMWTLGNDCGYNVDPTNVTTYAYQLALKKHQFGNRTASSVSKSVWMQTLGLEADNFDTTKFKNDSIHDDVNTNFMKLLDCMVRHAMGACLGPVLFLYMTQLAIREKEKLFTDNQFKWVWELILKFRVAESYDELVLMGRMFKYTNMLTIVLKQIESVPNAHQIDDNLVFTYENGQVGKHFDIVSPIERVQTVPVPMPANIDKFHLKSAPRLNSLEMPDLEKLVILAYIPLTQAMLLSKSGAASATSQFVTETAVPAIQRGASNASSAVASAWETAFPSPKVIRFKKEWKQALNEPDTEPDTDDTRSTKVCPNCGSRDIATLRCPGCGVICMTCDYAWGKTKK